MKILAIDSSGLVASVAVVEEDTLLAEFTLNYKKTHSQTLLPMLDDIKKKLDLDLDTIDAIAVAAGPGSFTGLRIGASTVKGLGLALKKPIIPVPTLEGLAYNLYGTNCLICPIMDARRSQVYTGIYEFCKAQDGMQMTRQLEQCALDVGELLARINKIKKEVIFLGDGVPVYRKRIEEECKVPFLFAPAQMNRQRASSIAVLGNILYHQGKYESAMDHAPIYLRMSQAERERLEEKNEKKQ